MIIAGIFAGGASARMGRPKGLIELDGVTLLDRAARMLESLELPVVLVGQRPEHAGLRYAQLADAVPNAGPLGGLVALLAHAGHGSVIALACDMPFVDRADVARLMAAPAAAALAPRRDGRWEPLCARYDVERVLPIARARLERGELALSGLLDAVGASVIEIDATHLRDWDTPEDVRSES